MRSLFNLILLFSFSFNANTLLAKGKQSAFLNINDGQEVHQVQQPSSFRKINSCQIKDCANKVCKAFKISAVAAFGVSCFVGAFFSVDSPSFLPAAGFAIIGYAAFKAAFLEAIEEYNWKIETQS